MTVALIRHGQTDWNLAGRVQGHTDIPLNDTGREQARLTAVALESGPEWRAITSSPLSRARETAEIIAAHLGLQLIDPLEGLIEQQYGEAEGVTIGELHERWPDRNIPGGEDQEALAKRGLQTLSELGSTGPRILAVSHGAYIRRLIATITDHDYLDVPRILNAGLNEITRESDNWRVLTLNGAPVAESLPNYLFGSGSSSPLLNQPAPKQSTQKQSAPENSAPENSAQENSEPEQPAKLGSLQMMGGSAASCTIDGVCN